MFEKSLQDLVKGIRTNKRDPATFISGAIAECKQELKSVDPYTKAQAVRKLTYLQMMGYDVSWASFAIVETMSQARFAHKRIGYLAACQCFSETTDVVLLATNLLKKEFQSTSQYEVGLAVNCLANIVTGDLARDLLQDSVLLMSHSKPYVRKKAVSAMFKLFIKYPQGLRLTFDKLKDRLADGEPAVTSCAVNVVCELANKNPNNYLSMAPQFFRLLTTSSNNWMLIKVVKLMGALVPQEPRLARKLLEPLATIIQNTAAKSLQYECIHTLTLALPYTKKADGTESRNVPGVVRLCGDHLRQFIDDPDQNLKYLGLVGFVELMKSHPRAVVEHRELVLLCLSDDDVTIRTRALELLTGMVTRKTLEELVVKLLAHVARADGAYRDELVSRIVHMCSRDKYGYLSDFVWYLGVLVKLARLRGAKHGKLLADQLVDITMRVKPVRTFAARDMVCLLLDERLEVGQGLDAIADVLSAAAWIAGEYASTMLDADDDEDDDDPEDDEDALPKFPSENPREKLVDLLTHPRVTRLGARVQTIYLQNALKVVALLASEGDDEELSATLELVAKRLDVFLQSVHVEVQERATAFRALLLSVGALVPTSTLVEEPSAKMPKPADSDDSDAEPRAAQPPPPKTRTVVRDVADPAAARLAAPALKAVAAEKMVPVNPKAQARVPLPDGLALDRPFLAGTALGDFLAPDDAGPEPSARGVSFVETPEEDYAAEAGGDPFEEKGGSGGFYDIQGSDSDGDDDDAPGSKKKKKKKDKKKKRDKKDPGPTNRAADADDPFYLAGSVRPADVDVDDVPVVRLTAADLKKKKRRAKKAGRSVARADVDVGDVMPEGAVDSDEERKRRRRAKKKAAQTAAAPAVAGDVDALDLSQIDLTAPLRSDEVMPTRRHRVVAAAPAPAPAPVAVPPAAPVSPPKKDKKASKKAKKEKSSSKKAKPPAPAGGGDLLDLLDFGAAPASTPPPPPAAAAPRDAFDLLGGGAPPARAAPPPPPKAAKSKGAYKPLLDRKGVVAEYRTSGAGLEVRVTNGSGDALSQVALAPRPPPGVTMSSVAVAAALAPGASAVATVACGAPGAAATHADATLSFYVEGLVADLVQAPVRLSLPLDQLLRAGSTTPADFAQLLTRHNWHSASCKVPVRRGGDAVAAVAAALGARVVERAANSASLHGATRDGQHVAVLVKQKDSKLKVDIKATSAVLAGMVAADLPCLSV